MNAPRKIIGTAGTHPAPHRPEGADVPQALHQSGAGLPLPCWHEPSNPSGGGSAVDLHTLNDGWGAKPRCPTCGRGQAGCICNMPEPEQEHFKPGLNRDPDWYRVEL